MSQTVTEVPGRVERPVGLPDRRLRPAVWWAAVGAAFVAVQLYVFTRWLLSGPTSIPRGPDPVPQWMEVGAVLLMAVSWVLWIGCVYWFVWRPWTRDRKVTTYGLVLFASTSTYWQNMGANYFQMVETNSTVFPNVSSWYRFIPGWVSPNAQNLAELPAVYLGLFYPFLLLGPLAIVSFMKWVKRRDPRMGKGGLISCAVVLACALDLVLETLFVRLGLYMYVGAVAGLTIFGGNYYQFPLYEVVLWGTAWAMIAVLYYFRDDHGNTVVERGLDGLRWSTRRKTVIRGFALAGMFNVIVLAYNIVFGIFTMQPGTAWSEDVVKDRSYMRSYVCGEGTEYACPGQDVPVARQGITAHLDPDGNLVQVPGASERRYLK